MKTINDYAAPQIEIIEVEVEQGFASSNENWEVEGE